MKWTTLRHNGVAFPPPYEYRALTVKIKGEPYRLNPAQEEMLMAWAKKKDTVYVQDPIFQQNFLGDLGPNLPERFADITLDDIDWTDLHAIVEREKTANLTPEEKKKRSAERKAVRDDLKAQFGQAEVDEVECEIGAYLVEPPGILMGRGAHPLRGKWKPRVEPEEVTLNLDEDAVVPSAPEGHQWGKVVHEHDSMWVASWYDKLSQKRKYVWLADSSHLRQERDKEKYLKAAKLEGGLGRVRAAIRSGMNHQDRRAHTGIDREEKKLHARAKELDAKLLQVQATEAGNADKRKKLEDDAAAVQKDLEALAKRREKAHAAEMKTRQIATVCYLIDRLAMRVGDEKDEDEADTVGASTLRVEHVHVLPDRIEFDFLGKDSVQWQKSIPRDDNERALARNLQDFMRGKERTEQIFDKIDSTHVNRFLGQALPGLTAKVFRTYHATTTVRSYLGNKGELKQDAATFEKEYVAKLANLEAAITCNHKRTPPKNWEQNLVKKEEAVEKLRAAKPDVTKLDAEIEKRETALNKLLEEQKQLEADKPRLVEEKEKTLAELQGRPAPEAGEEAAKLEKESQAAEKALEKTRAEVGRKAERLNERIAKAQEALAHAKDAPARATREYEERLAKAQRQLDLAKSTRDYNLGTSLKNYIDPRVYKAWGDYVGFEWKRLYTKTLQRKFAWVDQSRMRWNGSNQGSTPEDDTMGGAQELRAEAHAVAD